MKLHETACHFLKSPAIIICNIMPNSSCLMPHSFKHNFTLNFLSILSPLFDLFYIRPMD